MRRAVCTWAFWRVSRVAASMAPAPRRCGVRPTHASARFMGPGPPALDKKKHARTHAVKGRNEPAALGQVLAAGGGCGAFKPSACTFVTLFHKIDLMHPWLCELAPNAVPQVGAGLLVKRLLLFDYGQHTLSMHSVMPVLPIQLATSDQAACRGESIVARYGAPCCQTRL